MFINVYLYYLQAHSNRRFHHIDHDVIKGMLGVRRTNSRRTTRLGKTRHLNLDILDEFDSRQQWGSICPTLLEVCVQRQTKLKV